MWTSSRSGRRLVLFFLLYSAVAAAATVSSWHTHTHTPKWMNASKWKHDEVNFSHIVVTNLFHCDTTTTATTHSLCLLCFCYFVQIALIVIKWIYSSTTANAFNQRIQTRSQTHRQIQLTFSCVEIFLLLLCKRLPFFTFISFTIDGGHSKCSLITFVKRETDSSLRGKNKRYIIFILFLWIEEEKKNVRRENRME